MNAATDPANCPIRERLRFLVENHIRKGRHMLFLQLYEQEITGLSLAGAAKIISRDLGFSVGIQTIRTLRRKHKEAKSRKETQGKRYEGSPGSFDTPISELASPQERGSFLEAVEGFQPLDVFTEEYRQKNSMIKWAQQDPS
jgi:hypothetical protein